MRAISTNKIRHIIMMSMLLVSYIAASFVSNFLANLLAPMLTFYIAWVMDKETKGTGSGRKTWLFYLMVPLSWGIADTVWIIYENVLFIDPDKDLLVSCLYLLPNLFLMLTAINYFFGNVKRWYLVKVLLDVSVMFVVITGLASGLFFAKIDYSNLAPTVVITRMLYLSMDLITILIFAVMIISVKKSRLPLFLRYSIGGIALYVITDFVCFYEEVKEVYIVNGYLDYAFLISMVLFGISALMRRGSNRVYHNDKIEETPENLMQTKLVLWMSLVPVLLYLTKSISLAHFASIILAIGVYQFVNIYVQKSFIVELLLKEKSKIAENLERLVEERNEALIKANKELYEKSVTDVVTGLKNREFFQMEIKNRIEKEGQPFSVLFLALDRFNIIKDVHGHQMGDILLKAVAKRFLEESTETCFIARLGGVEFGLLVSGIDRSIIEGVCDRMIRMIEKPIHIAEYVFELEANIGVAQYPDDSQTEEQLLQYADIAMQHVKKFSVNESYIFFSNNLVRGIEWRNKIELALKNADFDQEFQLFYQPKFDIASRELIGMEALLRWHSVELGAVSPAEFIPISEENGYIQKITRWVIEKAFHQIGQWNKSYGTNLKMSINISPTTLDTYSFIGDLKLALKEHELTADWVELEITEHSAMSMATRIEEIFAALNNAGFDISIDDFGTGYSSLSYIKRFNFDTIKIAKELIDAITCDKDSLLIVHAIIMMSRGLEMKTLAEGVETEEQLKILGELGCDFVQGYVLGRPVPATVFEKDFLLETLNK